MTPDQSRARLFDGIAVAPLVDVCLVLLLIFMVLTPLLRPEEVELPLAANPERMPENPKQHRISLSAGPSPQVSLGSNPVPVSAALFREVSADLHAADPHRQLVLLADRRLAYGDVKDVLRTIRRAGFVNAGLIAERPR
jgi:biopolymer transport protein ExbD